MTRRHEYDSTKAPLHERIFLGDPKGGWYPWIIGWGVVVLILTGVWRMFV